MRRFLFLALFFFLMPITASGQTIINDGGTHSVATTSGPIKVLDGSTLQIEPGATITGNASIGSYGVYGDPSSTIQLLGGSVFGPATTAGGSTDSFAIDTYGAFMASTGSATGSSTATAGLDGGNGLGAEGSVSITGGTFSGGSGTYGGTGAVLTGGPGVSIAGGTFTGGAGLGAGAGLLLSQYGQTVVSGGTFVGGTETGGGYADSLSYQGLSMTSTASLEISGGTFTGAIDFDLATYGAGSLFFLGTGFSLNRQTLTGTLADGSSLDVTLISHDGNYKYWTAPGGGGKEEFGFGVDLGVPEPSTWLLLGLGVLGMAAVARQRPPTPVLVLIRKGEQ